MSSHSVIGRARLAPRGGLMRLTIALTAAVCLALPASAAATGTLDQSQTASDTFALVGGNFCEAQTFTAGLSGQLDQVDLLLHRVGDPGPLTVEIRTVSGGVPSSTVLASATVASASVPTNPTWVSVVLSPTVPSSAGTQYAIVLCAPGGDPIGNIIYGWAEKSGNPYPGGQLLRSTSAGATWAGLADFGDAAFKTYVVTDQGDQNDQGDDNSQE